MDNEKLFGTSKAGTERREDTQSDAANRARNRTVMLTPEVTGQVRALLNQGQQISEPTARELDGFAPVSGGLNSMSGLISRESVSTPSGNWKSVENKPSPSATTGAPLDVGIVNAVRGNSVGVVSEKLTPIVGFLVSYDSNPTGEVLELRSGRWIVSSERTTDGNFLIVKDPTVSPLHAILKISDQGEIQVLDQLSEHGTIIKHPDGEDEQLAGSMGRIDHGDTIAFGKKCFHVCIVKGAS